MQWRTRTIGRENVRDLCNATDAYRVAIHPRGITNWHIGDRSCIVSWTKTWRKKEREGASVDRLKR